MYICLPTGDATDDICEELYDVSAEIWCLACQDGLVAAGCKNGHIEVIIRFLFFTNRFGLHLQRCNGGFVNIPLRIDKLV